VAGLISLAAFPLHAEDDQLVKDEIESFKKPDGTLEGGAPQDGFLNETGRQLPAADD
jgi:hypothetical protein